MGIRSFQYGGSGAELRVKQRTGWPRPVWMLALCVLSAGVAVSSSNAAQTPSETVPQPYVFGVFPHLAVARLEKIYAPIAADFGRVLERKVYLRTKPRFEKFMAELRKQTYDIAFVQPFDYV